MTEVLHKNLLALRKYYPDLIESVAGAQRLPSGWEWHETPEGAPTLTITGESGRGLLLSSRYRPLEEAGRFGEQWDLANLDMVLLLGWGLGYQAEALRKKMGLGNRLFILEKDLRVFALSLSRGDYTELLQDERVFLLVAEEKEKIFGFLRDHVKLFFGGGRVRLAAHPPSVMAAESHYQVVKAEWDEFLRSGALLIRTAMILPRKSFENRILHASGYLASPGLEAVADRFAGYPAIIVSAGPSLARNVEQLAEARQRAVVIAVSTSLIPVLEKGIRPHYTVVLDFHQVSKRYFERVDPAVAREIPMVVDAKASYDAVKAYPGPRLFADDAFLDQIFKESGVKHATLSAGATVAHTAFFYACHLGCDPIIFVGQDLSFPYFVTHVPGTATYKSWYPELNRFYTYEMKEWDQVLRMRSILIRRKDVKGNLVYVDEQMLSYLKDFTLHFGKSGRRVVNATEGGALTEGVEILSLAATLEKYCRRELPSDLLALPEPALETLQARLEEGDRSLAVRLEDLNRMGEYYETSLSLLQRILRRAEQKKPLQHLVREVLEVKAKLKQYDHLYGLLCNLAASDNRKSQNDDQRIRAVHGEGDVSEAKQLDQARRDLDYLHGLQAARRFLRTLILEGRKILQEDLARVTAEAKEARTQEKDGVK